MILPKKNGHSMHPLPFRIGEMSLGPGVERTHTPLSGYQRGAKVTVAFGMSNGRRCLRCDSEDDLSTKRRPVWLDNIIRNCYPTKASIVI